MSNNHINDSYNFIVYGSVYFLNDTINDYTLLNKSIMKGLKLPPSDVVVIEKFLKNVWDNLNTVVKTVQISINIDKWDNATYIEYDEIAGNIDNFTALHTPSSSNVTVIEA